MITGNDSSTDPGHYWSVHSTTPYKIVYDSNTTTVTGTRPKLLESLSNGVREAAIEIILSVLSHSLADDVVFKIHTGLIRVWGL